MQHLAGQYDLAILVSIAAAITILTLFLAAVRANRFSRRAPGQGPSRHGDGHPGGTYWPARVLEVIDGETLRVRDSGRMLTLRLGSITCPSQARYFSDIARGGLAELIDGRDIVYEAHSRDELGRIESTIFVLREGKWTNVNALMVRLGQAWVKRDADPRLSSARQDELARMERWAKSNRAGIWGATDPSLARPLANGSGARSTQRSRLH
jgi:endonuclease YncB( thermonuclease family)